MADFCKQCSIEIFGTDTGDMRGISKWYHTLFRHYAHVLCEDCGPYCFVDHTGKCVSPDCLKEHGKQPAKGNPAND